ncbi:hypothetical protein ASNO1_77590 [Corallococcus caeni]|uniref:Uncharacterized protein n=1 Tax=Corallococcus caeni TaxID=3082388 RepID=A0ABQ6R5E6_9BACT|nr:hypothetical protein ASNO1_77590 [Corallococcus sp. NO1]
MPGEAGHGVRVEEVGGVLQPALEAPGGLGERERQVEHRRAGVHVHQPRLEARQHRGAHLRALEDEHHLEEGRVPALARGLERFHQLLEGHVLVRVRAHRRGAHPA